MQAQHAGTARCIFLKYSDICKCFLANNTLSLSSELKTPLCNWKNENNFQSPNFKVCTFCVKVIKTSEACNKHVKIHVLLKKCSVQ